MLYEVITAWFEVLEATGRDIHVYQSESVDFCTVPAVPNLHCNVFPIPNLKTVNREVPDIGRPCFCKRSPSWLRTQTTP